MIAPGGQAVMQSLHFVQRSRKSGSPTAPGGRSQSVRVGGGDGSTGTPSACLTSSRAALTVESTESFRKSRRPYEGLVGIQTTRLADGQNSCPARPQRAKGRGVRCRYVEALSEARTKLAAIFTIRTTSLHRHAACTLPHSDRRPRIPRPIPDDSRE